MEIYNSSKKPFMDIESIKYFPVRIVPMQKVYAKGDIKYFNLFGLKIPYGYAFEDLYVIDKSEDYILCCLGLDVNECISLRKLQERINDYNLEMFLVNNILFDYAEIRIKYYSKNYSIYKYFQNDTEAKKYLESLLSKCEAAGNKLTVEV